MTASARRGPRGPVGPPGPAGPVGPEGPEGPLGPAGQQGVQGYAGPPGIQGPTGAQGAAGADGQTYDFVGAWSGATTYSRNQVVAYQGASFISQQDANTNHTPDPATDTAWWGRLALAGSPGPQGSAGPQGPQGPQSAQGAAGAAGAAGATGPAGPGLASGGSTAQVARKASNANYDTEWHTPVPADIGLGNVDNTPDSSKPVSTPQQSAIDVATALHVEELTSPYTIMSPSPEPIPAASFTVRKGGSPARQFVAKQSTVVFQVFASARLYGAGESFAGLSLWWQDQTANPGYTGQLTPTKVGALNDPSVQGPKRLAVLQSPNGALVGSIAMTGLTVGHTYRFELELDVLGAFSKLYSNPNERHWACALSANKMPPPDPGRVLVSRAGLLPANTTGRIAVWKIARGSGFRDEFIGSVEMPAGCSTQGRVAVTPDGTKAVVTSVFASAGGAPAITVINTGAPPHRSAQIVATPAGPILGGGETEQAGLGWNAPSLFNTAVYNGNVLAADDVPDAVSITPDGVYALVGIRAGTHIGRIAKITIASGAVSYSAQLDPAATPSDIALDAAGTYAYVSSDGTDKKVYKLQVSDLAVVATSAALGQAPKSLDLDRSGATTNLYVVGGAAGSATIYHLAQSNLALGTTFNAAVPYPTLQPKRCRMFDDGRTLMIVSDGPADVQAMVQYEPRNGDFFQGWGGVTGGDYTGDFTNGSNVVSNIAKTAGWSLATLVPGLPLSGTGIPANTFIGTINSANNSLTMVDASGAAANATSGAVGRAFHSYNPIHGIALSPEGDLFVPDWFGQQIASWAGCRIETLIEGWLGEQFTVQIRGGD